MSNDMKLIMKNWKKTLNESKEPVKNIVESEEENDSTNLLTLDISELKDENLQAALQLLNGQFRELTAEITQAERFNDSETASWAQEDKDVIRKKILQVTKRIEDQAKVANATETKEDDKAIQKIAFDAAEKVSELPSIGANEPTDEEINGMFDAIKTSLDQGEEIVKKTGEEEAGNPESDTSDDAELSDKQMDQKYLELLNSKEYGNIFKNISNYYADKPEVAFDVMSQFLLVSPEKQESFFEGVYEDLPNFLNEYTIEEHTYFFLKMFKENGFNVPDEDNLDDSDAVNPFDTMPQTDPDEQDNEPTTQGRPSNSAKKGLEAKIKKLADEGEFQKIVDLVDVLENPNLSIGDFEAASGFKIKAPTLENYKAVLTSASSNAMTDRIDRALEEIRNANTEEERRQATDNLSDTVKELDKTVAAMDKRYEKLKPKLAEKLDSMKKVDLSDNDSDSKSKFQNLEIMNSPAFVFFLYRALSSLNEEIEAKEYFSMAAVKNAIKDNMNDVKFIQDNTDIKIDDLLRKKFGSAATEKDSKSREDLKAIVADIKEKYTEKKGSGNGFKAFVGGLASSSKGGDGKIDPAKLQAAAEEALENLTNQPDDTPSEDAGAPSGFDALLQLDGQEFIDALIQFYRDNELIDKEGVKSGLTTIRSAFKDLPVDAEVFMDEPGDLEVTEEPPVEDDSGAETLPEVYIIDEAEEANPVGQAIATITSDSVLPDNIIPFEAVPDLRDKLKSILKVKDEEVKSPKAAVLTSEDLSGIMAAESGKDLMRALLDLLKEKFGGNIPEEFRKSIKLVLRKEPKAIVNMVDSPMLKMDVLDGEELAKKIAKFYPPEEDFSDNPMMTNLDADERKILKFINTVFRNREVSIETSSGKELSFSGKDMKKRYLDSLGAVRNLNKDILPAIVITLNQEATGGVLEEEEEEEELQEFFSSKKSDQTMSLVNTVRDVMGRSNPKFIGNYRNFKKAFGSSAFRKFYGDLKKLVNAFMNSELIKIDDEEVEQDDFETDTQDTVDSGVDDTPPSEPSNLNTDTDPSDADETAADIVDNEESLTDEEKEVIGQELSESESWYKSLSDEQQQAVATFTFKMADKGVEMAPLTDDELSDETPIAEEMTDDDLNKIKPFAAASKRTFPSDFSSAMEKVMNEIDDNTKELVLNVMVEDESKFVEYLTTMFKVQTKMGKIKDILRSWGAKIVDAIPDSIKTKVKDLANKFPKLIAALKATPLKELGYFKSWMLSLMNTSKDVATSTIDDIRELPNSEFVKFLNESAEKFTKDQLLKLKASYAMAKEPVKAWLDALVAVAVISTFDTVDAALKAVEAVKDLVKGQAEKFKDSGGKNIRNLALIALLKFGNPKVSGEEEMSGYRTQADNLPNSELPTVEPRPSKKSAPRKKSTYSGDANYDNNIDALDNKLEEALKPIIKRAMSEMRAAK